MKLGLIVEASRRVVATSGRKAKVSILAELLERTPADDVPVVVHYLAGSLPQGRIGLGPAALRETRGTPPASESSLMIGEVDDAFTRIGEQSGPGSTQARLEILGALLARAPRDEQDFLVRLLYGELRQGALEGIMLDAVAVASTAPLASLRRAAMASGTIAPVAAAALLHGESALAAFRIEVFRPVQPMLAQTADDPVEALERLGEASLEYKLDGARIQVHKADGIVRVYSRTLREVTGSVPEVVECAQRLPHDRLILDGEVLALRPDGTPHPFQVTMRRFGRKRPDAEARSTLPLTPVFFDALLVGGTDIVDQAQRDRAETLRSVAADYAVPQRLARSPGEAQAFLDEALQNGHEGIMAKSPGAAYEAGSRGYAWMKLKSAHTLDLVVLAAEWGSGRRKGWLSNLHLGARDPVHGGFVMLGKTFKGLTDQTLAWQTQRFQELEIGRDAHTVYVKPEIVAEIAFNDVQASPHYSGGMALRFARVKRYRSDKTAEDADTIETVREIYRRATGEDPPPSSPASGG